MATNADLPPKLAFFLVGPGLTLALFAAFALFRFQGTLRLYVLAGGMALAGVEYLFVDWYYDRQVNR